MTKDGILSIYSMPSRSDSILRHSIFKIDEIVKNRNLLLVVIPAEAGIQCCQILANSRLARK